MRRITTPTLLGLLIGLGASCFDEESTLGLPCTEKASCGEGQDCVDGFCLKTGKTIFDECGNAEPREHEYCYDDAHQGVLGAPAARFRAHGDLNGDGLLDFAVIADGKIQVGTYTAGAFPATAVADMPNTGEVWGLAVGDVSGDGLDDIVLLADPPPPDYQVRITTFVNNGGGGNLTMSETDTVSMSWYHPPVIADMDGDGMGDLFAVDSDEARNAFYWKRLTDGYVASPQLEAGRFQGSRATIVGRFDGDNTDDVVYVQKEGLVVVIKGDTMDPPRLGFEVAVEPDATNVVQADLDGDVFPDLVVSHGDPALVTLLKGKGNGDFEVLDDPIEVPVGAAADAADIDGDGHLDLVVGGPEGIQVIPGFAGREFGIPLSLGPAMDIRRLWLQDADGDDALDVVIYDRVDGGLARSLVLFGNP